MTPPIYDRRRHSRRAGEMSPADRERIQGEWAERWGRMAAPVVEIVDPRVPTKRCRTCGQVKGLEAFGRHRGCAFGRRSHCRACIRTLDARRYQQNRTRNQMVS